MAINIITYPGIVREAVYDAMAFDAIVGASGIFYGCEMTATPGSNTIKIAPGYGIIKGRLFNIDSEISITVASSLDDTNVYGKVWLELNLSGGDPIKVGASSTYQSSTAVIDLLTNNNINFIGGSVHQVELGTFKMSTTGLVEITQTMGGVITMSSGLIDSLRAMVEATKKKSVKLTPASGISEHASQWITYNNSEATVNINFSTSKAFDPGATLFTGVPTDICDALRSNGLSGTIIRVHPSFMYSRAVSFSDGKIILGNQTGNSMEASSHYFASFTMPLTKG